MSPEKAARCLGNRTLAFIGDSQIRDLCVGVVYFLMGVFSLESASEDKFDGHHDMGDHGTKIEDFDFWMHNVPGHNFNGYIFPRVNESEALGIKWQVQMWNLFTGQFLENGQMEDVLSNKLVTTGRGLKPIDLAFFHIGLHDWGWWYEGNVGLKFYDTMVQNKLFKKSYTVPSVWTSMNPECLDKLSGSITGGRREEQQEMVDIANAYTNERLLREKLPYFDFGAPLRSADRCDKSADGVHVKMYVNIMAAKMLFNHLCDSRGEWRGGIDQFK
jgi:hypothetical protein